LRRLTRIDEQYRRSYHYLREEDQCYFLGEYTPRKGYDFGETNDLISNLKKGMDRRDKPEWRWKLRAIETAGAWLAEALAEDRPWLAATTFVPIPPSSVKIDPSYDDRIVRVLRHLERLTDVSLDVRELLYQTETTRASSRSDQRLTLAEIRAVYRIDQQLSEPPPRQIALVDDLLTSGAHFRAAKELLGQRYPRIPIGGIFLARSTH
jgi:hypothetical protein